MLSLQVDGEDASRPRRNFGLDLVRAIAVSLVLASHYGGIVTWNVCGCLPLSIFVPGYFGVELFFALSGFLIGDMMLSIVASGITFLAWRRFMLRRLMRTLPAYYVWMLVILIIRRPDIDFSEFLSYVFLVQNLAWPMVHDVWYNVTWSLTVEEWFYLIFSSLTLVCSFLVGQRSIAAALCIVIAFSLVVKAAMPTGLPWDVYLRKSVWTRLDAIAYGVLLAKICRETTSFRRFAGPLCAAGALLLIATTSYWIAVVGVWDSDRYLFRIGIFLAASLGFSIMLPFAVQLRCDDRRIRAVVGSLSRLSYSLYLVHFTFIGVLWPWIEPRGAMSMLAGGIGLSLSFVSAVLLNRLVEVPVMALRPKQVSYAG